MLFTSRSQHSGIDVLIRDRLHWPAAENAGSSGSQLRKEGGRPWRHLRECFGHLMWRGALKAAGRVRPSFSFPCGRNSLQPL